MDIFAKCKTAFTGQNKETMETVVVYCIYKAMSKEEVSLMVLLTGRLEALSKYMASMAQAQPPVA